MMRTTLVGTALLALAACAGGHAASAPSPAGDAAEIRAEYATDLGRPTSYWIDSVEMMADEEHGSLGTAGVLEHLAGRLPDACIVGEPTWLDVIVAHRLPSRPAA